MRINPFNRGNPMSLKDAMIISTMTATATYFLAFLVNVSFGQVVAEPWTFAFESFKIWMQAFWGNFIVLFGLEQYLKRRAKE